MGQTVELMERITVNPDQCGGRPCVRGMRIRVIDVLDLLASGLSAAQVVEELPDLELADVTASLRFASRRLDHPVLTKDADFVQLLGRLGAPPQIVWLTCGNTSNAALREILNGAWPRVVDLLEAGEPLVEISGRAS